jgi:hypothetical protein
VQEQASAWVPARALVWEPVRDLETEMETAEMAPEC